MNSNSSDDSDHSIKGDRIRAGLARARGEGKQIGRPRVEVSYEVIVQLREAGLPWSKIARQTGAGAGTVRRAFQRAVRLTGACQNPPAGAV